MEPQRFISYLSSLFRNRSKFWSIPNVLTDWFWKAEIASVGFKDKKKEKKHRGTEAMWVANEFTF